MPLDPILAEFKASLAQCESLIANAHKTDAGGAPILSRLDHKQITIAAFLNMFIAWEAFLESSMAGLMAGDRTISGAAPVKYVMPLNTDAARELVVGIMRYFDYGNHDHIRKIVRIYFRDGYPYEPHLSAIFSDLADLRTMRNACAHITATTQTALDALVLRIFSGPMPGIDLYQLLTAIDPRSTVGGTVFDTYKTKLIVAAELIAQG
jgi:hypothetical protein